MADDHVILRSGLKMLINAQPDMEVVSEAPDGHRATLATRDATRRGIAGSDNAWVRRHGCAKEIVRCCPHTRLLILSMHDDTAYLRSVLAAGASGYVLKRDVDTELLATIRAVHRGAVFIDPRLAHVFVQDALDKTATGSVPAIAEHPQRTRAAGARTRRAGVR